MLGDLTFRQRQILEFIRTKTHERGYPPSVREIGEAVGLASSSTVHGHLSRLEDKGYIRRDPSKPRAIEILAPAANQGHARSANHLRSLPAAANEASGTVAVPVLGRVAAGVPILAEENVEETFPLPETWVRGGEVFMLNVHGDSMVEAGILDGDRVVVRKQHVANNGDIVVARLGDEATVKRYFQETDRIRLQPENSRMQPIFARDVQVEGKVIGLIREM